MSVHADVEPRWLKIQNEFLKSTIDNFVHAICLVNTNPVVPDDVIVIAHHSYAKNGGVQHIAGLRSLSNYAKKHHNQYRSFLVLDSDCFPISKWENPLINRMANYSKKIACIIRPENLDTFPHPAAVYTDDSTLLNFDFAETVNLLGEKTFDNRCSSATFFPMIRTNRTNLHPISYGIYYNMFYHHGAGSRKSAFRSDGYYKIKCHNHDDEFFKDPRYFIDKLCKSF